MISEQERWRYARQLMLPGLGLEAQDRLRAARVLVVGAGGLGSPALTYLAAAGVGCLGIVDYDIVEESNLQRQFLHGTPDLGRPKTASAAEKLRALNPLVEVVEHRGRLVAANAFELIDSYDLVVNGVDNFPARFLLNDACVMHRRTLVDGGVLQYYGVAMTIKGGESACYRCLFPAFVQPDSAQCATEEGVLGPVPGLIGMVQAIEAIKLITGFGQPLLDRMLQFDAVTMTFDEVPVLRDPDCPVCGVHPTVTELHDHEVHSATCRLCMAGAIGREAHWDAQFAPATQAWPSR